MTRPGILRNWFLIRRDLPHGRRLLLSIISFLLPLAVWTLVSYVPWIWHPDMKIRISAEREGVTTVFTSGDHVSREFFPEFADAVRQENQAVLAARASGTVESGGKRKNQKLLRQIAPVAIDHGWLPYTEAQNDPELYKIWRDLASGTKVATDPALSPENLEIVRQNWATLGARSPEFAYRELPDEPLLKLVPQGDPANPVYLPAPHEVLKAGYRDFTAEVPEGEPTMGQRYAHSLRVILAGFLWSCLIGIPLGILCGVFDFFSKLFEPFVDFFRYMPAPTFSTLLVAVLLAGDAPKVALVFIGTVFQMILVVSKTTKLLDPSLLEAAQTLGAKPRQMITRVVIPGILPNLYNDLRILLGWAWTWLVIAELIGVKSGLTEFIETQGRFRNFDRVFPIIILIGVTGFVTDQVLSWLHGVFFPWAGKSGKLSRAVADAVMWPVRTVAAGARERIAADEADRELRRNRPANS
ncbi:NitT/TauT family transport system permease protein [Haloferula luteola]|uniref:NitT/TauT family transport system permease protein n=1 Tax=Haloferula luteola TaxID=595692 RepID=A0A840V1I1_9BACT|nr:ABC transporter permease [Haloferula luteola]MBB5350916.1 NitT/TauT family transport system permease protein [Haloferula luteola]